MRLQPGAFFVIPKHALPLLVNASGASICVYLHLADMADESGCSRPSLSILSQRTGLHRGTVCRAIQSLESAGLIRRSPGSRGRASEYQVVAQAQLDSRAHATSSSRADATKVVAQAHKSSRAGAPPTKRKNKKGASPSLNGDLFEKFWSLYPKRDGRKIGRPETRTRFAKFSDKDQHLIIQALKNYIATERGRNFPKDPERFLKKDFWRNWLDPPEPSPAASTQKAPPFFKPGD